MIPDFKTYIKESIWSDIQDRSTGNVVRKEDDINLLEPDDFITYIEKNYSMDNSPMEIINNKATSTIFIPFCTALRGVKIGMIFFDYDNMDIYTHNSIQIYIPRLWKKLNTFFDLSSNHFQEHYNTSIKPKDVSRKITNSYVLEVLNFIIDNIDDDVNDDDVELCIFRKTNESIWSDIQDRSAGDIIRKEDDVNHLNIGDFYQYIKARYDGKVRYVNKDNFLIPGINNICVDISEHLSLYISYNTSGKFNHITMFWGNIMKPNPSFLKELEKAYKLEEIKYKAGRMRGERDPYRLSIKEKNGTCTNQTFINLINLFIDRLDQILVEDVKESIWSDIQDRSSGETVRKEDEINRLDISGLWDYINDNYKNLSHREAWVSKHDTGSFIHLPMFNRFGRLFGIYIKFNTDKLYAIQIEANKRICSEFISILEKDYEIDDNGGFGMVMIKSKTNEFTNTDVIHIIDLIIENSSEPALEKK